ncbi:hypothetical protein FHS59_004683 [Algoriphagus iocasae]|uniref:6-bladed beta-propeller protein n=1 Tax=Algoriphagus iocasae TaxID=1836499 RepID=A0A841MTC5_9BACT|nr:6-bladed beta-propeller [Algoriphagus iocasae]MBB6329019.1 hypothetical protein [Algoriphagus iocasae]
MRKKIQRFLCPILILIFTIISCKTKDENSTHKFSDFDREKVLSENIESFSVNESEISTTIKVPKNLNNEFYLSDVIDSVWYVKLGDIPSDIMTDNLLKIKIYKKRIYVLDGKNQDLYVFKENGDFLFPIYSSGMGPGEFTKVSSFSIVPDKDQIVVFDDRLSKILYYTLDGQFLKENRIGFRFLDFEFIDNNTIAVDLNKTFNDHIPEIENNQLVMVDSTWKIISKAAPYDASTERGLFFSGKTLRNGIDGLTYLQPFTSTVYSIDKSKIVQPKIFIDLDKNALPENTKFNMSFDDFMGTYGLNHAFLVENGYDLKDVYYFEMHYEGGKRRYAFHSKSTGNIFYGIPNRDLEILGFFHISTSIPEDNVLISYVSSEEIAATKSSILDYGIKDKNLIDVLEKTYDDDNPVLIFYKLRKNF